jgi:hypothetical protein
LSKESGEKSSLVLGGVNPAYAKSEFVYHKLSSATYWGIDIEAISFDGEPIESD